MRKAFADALIKAAEENPKLAFLTGDLGFQVFDGFREKFGSRYINVGVAEAQMVCCAAGMAHEGWRPVAYSIASFLTGRAFEFIRISVAYAGLPVVVVGAGGGYTYSASGITHHAAEDLGLMSLLPGFTVVAPGDAGEVTALLPQVLQLTGPSYFRVGRFGEGTFEAEEACVLGRARRIASGKRILIATTGDMAVVVCKAVKLLQSEGIDPLVYQFHTVKPLDTRTLDRIAPHIQTVLAIEEHSPRGGLAAAIAEWCVSRTEPLRVVRLGPPDQLALGNLEREQLRKKLGFDSDAIIETCRRLWRADALAAGMDC
jgi:transketolase